jgi:hypothetical protein
MFCFEKATNIDFIDDNIDYIMCIDENNYTNRIKYVLKQIADNKEISEDDRYFTITGCIFTKKTYFEANKIVKELKNKYWSNGKHLYRKYKEERLVCLHSREIRRHEDPFGESIIDYNSFIIDLSKTMNDIDCIVISINVNFYEYIKKGYTYDTYSIAFDFLLERYIIATKNKKQGIIVLESRGKEEDKKLLTHISNIITKTGTRNIKSKELLNKIKGVYFNSKWNDEYSDTFTGLEITDLFSYPIHKYIKYGTRDKAFQIIETKLSGYPDYKNKGIKIFP